MFCLLPVNGKIQNDLINIQGTVFCLESYHPQYSPTNHRVMDHNPDHGSPISTFIRVRILFTFASHLHTHEQLAILPD